MPLRSLFLHRSREHSDRSAVVLRASSGRAWTCQAPYRTNRCATAIVEGILCVDASATRHVRPNALQLRYTDSRSSQALWREPEQVGCPPPAAVRAATKSNHWVGEGSEVHDRSAHVPAVSNCRGSVSCGLVGCHSRPGTLASLFSTAIPAAGRCRASHCLL